MRASAAEVLRETVRDQHPSETFEKALGRVVRKHQGTFRDYTDLILRVRERAKKARSSLDDAARELAKEL